VTLIRQYLNTILKSRKLLIQTLLLCFALMIYTPFIMIALRSVGRGWFGRLWLPPELTLDWYRWAVEVTNIVEITKNTLLIAVLAVLMSTAIAIPTAFAKPCPSGPVVVSTPGVRPCSGCPGVREPHCRNRSISSRGRSNPDRCSNEYRSIEP